MKIVIDAGHGPNTPGKRCPDDSMREYSFNSAVARYLDTYLQNYEGVETKFTFEDSRDVPINERYKVANAWPAEVFVSIHANAMGTGWNDAGGIETLVDYRKPVGAVELAQAIQKEMVAATGLNDRGLQYRDDLGVLNYTNMNAILVECGFMTNRNEAVLLKSDSYRKKCAYAIARGLAETYNLKPKAGITLEKKTDFTDVDAGRWSEGVIASVKSAGIMSGYDDGTFKPTQPVTREEMAAAFNQMLYLLNNK